MKPRKERYVASRRDYRYAFLLSLGVWRDDEAIVQDYNRCHHVETVVIKTEAELKEFLGSTGKETTERQQLLTAFENEKDIILINSHGDPNTGELVEKDGKFKITPEQLADYLLTVCPHVKHLKIKNLSCYGGTSKFFERFENQIKKNKKNHPIKEVTLIGSNLQARIGRKNDGELVENNVLGERTLCHFFISLSEQLVATTAKILNESKPESADAKAAKQIQDLVQGKNLTELTHDQSVALFIIIFDEDLHHPDFKEIEKILGNIFYFEELKKLSDKKLIPAIFQEMQKQKYFENNAQLLPFICQALQSKKIKNIKSFYEFIQHFGREDEEKNSFKLAKEDFALLFNLENDAENIAKKFRELYVKKIFLISGVRELFKSANKIDLDLVNCLLELHQNKRLNYFAVDVIQHFGVAKAKLLYKNLELADQQAMNDRSIFAKLQNAYFQKSNNLNGFILVLIKMEELKICTAQNIEKIIVAWDALSNEHTIFKFQSAKNSDEFDAILICVRYVDQIYEKLYSSKDQIKQVLKYEITKIKEEKNINFDIFLRELLAKVIWFKNPDLILIILAEAKSDSHKLELINLKNHRGQNSLHTASGHSSEIFLQLLKLGGDVKSEDNEGNTILHRLPQCNSITEAKSLLKECMSRDEKLITRDNKANLTPLETAVRDNNFFVVAAFLQVHKFPQDVINRTIDKLLSNLSFEMFVFLLAGFPNVLGKENVEKVSTYLNRHHHAVNSSIYPIFFERYFDLTMCVNLAGNQTLLCSPALCKKMKMPSSMPPKIGEGELDRKNVTVESLVRVFSSVKMSSSREIPTMLLNILPKVLHCEVLDDSLNLLMNMLTTDRAGFENNLSFLIDSGATLKYYYKYTLGNFEAYIQQRKDKFEIKDNSVQTAKMCSEAPESIVKALKLNPLNELESKQSALVKIWNTINSVGTQPDIKPLLMHFIVIFNAVNKFDNKSAVENIVACIVIYSADKYKDHYLIGCIREYLFQLLQIDNFFGDKESDTFKLVTNRLAHCQNKAMDNLAKERQLFFDVLQKTPAHAHVFCKIFHIAMKNEVIRSGSQLESLMISAGIMAPLKAPQQLGLLPAPPVAAPQTANSKPLSITALKR